MSGQKASNLELLLSKSLSVQSAGEEQARPEDFSSALTELVAFSEKQLPRTINLDFKPVCFDISKDEENLIIGGEHGNIALFNIPTRYKAKDEEICVGYHVVSVLYCLGERQIVLSSSKAELFFLDSLSLAVLGSLDLKYSPVNLNGVTLNVIMKLGAHEDFLYFSRFEQDVNYIRLSNDKGYYKKNIQVDKVRTEGRVLCLDISDDATLLAVGEESGKVSLIHADSSSILQSTEENPAMPILIAFGGMRKILAAGFNDNTVRVWSIDHKLTIKYEIKKHSDLVTGISFVNENRYLVTSSYDGNVSISDMEIESKPFSLNLYDDKVICFRSSRDGKKIFYSQSKNSILEWEIPQLHKNARYSVEETLEEKQVKKRKKADTELTVIVKPNVNKLIFLPNSFELLSVDSGGRAILWDFRNNLRQDLVQLDGELINAAVPSTGEYALITSNKPCIFKWDFKTGVIDEYEFNPTPIAISFSNDSYTVAISDSVSRVIIYDADVMERKFVLKRHKNLVSALVYSQDDSFLFTGSFDTEIMKWNMETGEFLTAFKGHENIIKSMILSQDNNIISASDEVINVWNVDGVLVYRLELTESEGGPVTGLYISLDGSYLIVLHEDCAKYWQMENLSKMFQIDSELPAKFLAVSVDEKFVAVAEGTSIFIEENPMNSSMTRIVGKNAGSRHKYLKFIIESQGKEQRADYSIDFNHWVVVPYLIGISHILAYSNRIDDLNTSLTDTTNRAGFFSTINLENPLKIAIDLEYKNIIDVCLKYMKCDLNNNNNMRAFAPMERCLTELNSIEYPETWKIYELIWNQSSEIHLPAFCLHETELPILYSSEHLELIAEEIVEKKFISSTGRPVVFKQSLCKLDMELGTVSSLEFLQSLLLYGDQKTYETDIVREYLMKKWEGISGYIYLHGSLYITYMIVLSVYTVNFMESNYFFSVVIFMELVLFGIELLQLFTDLANYFFDVWNIFDTLRTLSFFYYMFNVFVVEDFFVLEDGLYCYSVLFPVIVFSWVRGISFFRMLEETRFMVRMIGMVILDMRVFFTILAYSTVGFSFIFYLRNPEQEFFIYLMTSYRLDLGDFSTDFTAVFDWTVFFLATMMNPMIMLNLLISILSGTAENVGNDRYVADLRELTRMTIEVEKIMFWKKQVTNKNFLQKCAFIEDEEPPDKMIEKCRFIKSRVSTIKDDLEEANKMLESVRLSDLEKNIELIEEEQDRMREEMTANFEVNNSLLAKISEKLGLSS